MAVEYQPTDENVTNILIIGDEVESCLTAVSAARVLGGAGKVTLWCRDDGLLGGLCTRAQLSYMDITPEWVAPLFGEFLTRAGVERVALNRHKAHNVLKAMLDEAGVDVVVGGAVTHSQQNNACWLITGEKLTVMAGIVLDTTPDADMVAGVFPERFSRGLEGLLSSSQNQSTDEDWPDTLGVTPVFHSTGITPEDIIGFEASLRQRPDTAELIAKGLPWLTADEQAALLERPVFCQQDYVDVLNPVIGLWFHHWCGYAPSDYPMARVKVDGFNISQLGHGNLGWNGLVARVDDVASQLAYSRGEGLPWPEALTRHLDKFQAFLRDEGGMAQAVIIPPERLYIRQTRNLRQSAMLSAEDLFAGGCSADEAIGTFSYWIDLRGVSLRQRWPETADLPKPTFNVGLAPYMVGGVENLGVISRSGAYGPVAQGACRIVQHLAQVGEAMGVMAALASQQQKILSKVDVAQVRQQLNHRYATSAYRQWVVQETLPTEGCETLSQAACYAHPGLKAEQQCLN